jgi:hypothetical protein
MTLAEYEHLCVKDEEMEQMLARIAAPRLRWFLIAVMVATGAGFTYSIFVVGISFNSLFLFLVELIAIFLLAQRFLKERDVLQQFGRAVGTIYEQKEVRGRRGGRHFQMKYAFLSADGRVFVDESTSQSRQLSAIKHTVPVVYKLADPGKNICITGVTGLLFYKLPGYGPIRYTAFTRPLFRR